jgi:hypothetical protein
MIPWPEPEVQHHAYIGERLSFIKAAFDGRTFFVAAVEDEPVNLEVRTA